MSLSTGQLVNKPPTLYEKTAYSSLHQSLKEENSSRRLQFNENIIKEFQEIGCELWITTTSRLRLVPSISLQPFPSPSSTEYKNIHWFILLILLKN